MRIYKFQKGMSIIRDYEGEGQPCGVTEITKYGSNDMDIQSFDLDDYLDGCEKIFGELEATTFLGEYKPSEV